MKPSQSKHAPGKSGRKLSGAVNSVESEIERLQGQGIIALRDYWARRFRRPAPPIQSADLLHRLIAWQLQVEAYGDLDTTTKQMIARLMRAKNGNGALPRSALNPLKTGSVLVREWRGVEHRVLVLDDGAAPSIPESRPRKVSIRPSTLWMHSARPAWPISAARPARAGSFIPRQYDDGGFSGGNMERPALGRGCSMTSTTGVLTASSSTRSTA
jgi:hypothetical protein